MDIDIDTATSVDPLKHFKTAIKASMVRNEELSPHPCGVYFQNIPVDPVTSLSAIPYEDAENLGFFKIDFLHLSVYDHFSSRDEIKELIKIPPDWNLLTIPSVVSKLFQLSKHYDILKLIRPTSVLELADCLALIRPQKRYLMDLYLRDKTKARVLLYTAEHNETYGFKKAHAISYAYVIILQLHLIKGGIV